MDQEIGLEELRKYQDIKDNLKSIRAEIDSLYSPVSSAPITSDGAGRSLTPGDPTARAVHEILKRKDKLEALEKELTAMTKRVTDYVDSMTDHHTAAIIRYHFIIGLSWSQTCRMIYGYPDPDICRKAVRRYFQKKKDVRLDPNNPFDM